MTRSTNAILGELAIEQATLAELERTRDEARAKIESLRSELAVASATTPLPLPLSPAVKGKSPDTPADKVKLFRSLFRGRSDIFPDPVRQQENRQTRLRSGVLKQMGTGTLPAQDWRQVQRLRKSRLRPRRRPGCR